MALTTEQETSLLALLDSIPSDELVNINDLSDAGTLAATTNFPVQQSNAGDVGQKITRSSMIFTEEMDETDLANKVKSVTPAAFKATNATEDSPGTIYTAAEADISEKTSSIKALTPSVQDALFEEMIKNTGTIDQDQIDSSTQGTVVIDSLVSGAIGSTCHWVGSFTFKPTDSGAIKYVFITNVESPAFKQTFTGWYQRSDKSGSSFPMCGFIVAVGTADENGLGSVSLELRDTEDRSWDSSLTMTMFFNFRYFI